LFIVVIGVRLLRYDIFRNVSEVSAIFWLRFIDICGFVIGESGGRLHFVGRMDVIFVFWFAIKGYWREWFCNLLAISGG
jgi:hypothetical protein